jgi:hypothetical protein
VILLLLQQTDRAAQLNDIAKYFEGYYDYAYTNVHKLLQVFSMLFAFILLISQRMVALKLVERIAGSDESQVRISGRSLAYRTPLSFAHLSTPGPIRHENSLMNQVRFSKFTVLLLLLIARQGK